MFLQDKETGTMVEVLDVEALISPTEGEIHGKMQSGQEEQEPAAFPKDGLIFPSGESLPRCWVDANYRSEGQPGS